MPVRVNSQQAASKWSQRLSAATQQVRDGVQRVTVSPGQKAAAAADLWLQRTMQSKDKFRNNVGRVSLADWQNAMLNKGIDRISAGATAAEPKMERFMAEFLPHLQAGVSAVERMPKGTLEQSIARAAAMIQHNARFRRGGTGTTGA